MVIPFLCNFSCPVLDGSLKADEAKYSSSMLAQGTPLCTKLKCCVVMLLLRAVQLRKRYRTRRHLQMSGRESYQFIWSHSRQPLGWGYMFLMMIWHTFSAGMLAVGMPTVETLWENLNKFELHESMIWRLRNHEATTMLEARLYELNYSALE